MLSSVAHNNPKHSNDKKPLLFHLVGREEQRNMYVETTASPVTRVVKQHPSNFTLQQKSLNVASPDIYTRKVRRDRDGNEFVEFYSTSNATVFIQVSPQKDFSETNPKNINVEQPFVGKPSLHEVNKANPQLIQNARREQFEFEVTKEMIDARRGAAREKTQQNVYGTSAATCFSAENAVMPAKSKSSFHLAHRQGHCLNGSQTKTNLDPATAGSNYTTLFLIENPIIELFNRQNIALMNVKGVVTFDPRATSSSLPLQVTYNLSWGNGRTAQIIICPLNHRHPTMDENTIAIKLLEAARTPPAATSSEDKSNYQQQQLLSSARKNNSFFSADKLNSIDKTTDAPRSQRSSSYTDTDAASYADAKTDNDNIECSKNLFF